ncbi:hypothetical protein SAMN04244572_03258 [Azotobacter beijerinckii]|uniref:Uncharacterized protein n=1 Tax=Azotobacter beijerinckii TaxID=170623 RepID=A0A1H6X5W8_9GAMM|nr:hypothetical protein [Azotobacter beijerinckii]SEI85127.1 hypothetical protein SAMN04244579_02214 [Azotobacter beijerinckii]SEJ24458.1 hypothetical protein SAMN04244572_03258 [Azotobacter beijerinckii]
MQNISRPSGDPALEARQLLDMWQSLSLQHVSMGGSCACGMGGVTLQLQDFEQDILDYLSVQAERAKRSDVSSYLSANAVDPESGRWDLSALLNVLGNEERVAEVSPDISRFLLERLGKTLRSFARLHG